MAMNTDTIETQLTLAQFHLKPESLSISADDIIEYVKEKVPVLFEIMSQNSLAGRGRTVGDLFLGMSNVGRREASWLLNIILSGSFLSPGDGDGVGYDKKLRGMPVGASRDIEHASGQALTLQPLVRMHYYDYDPVHGLVVTAHYRTAFFFRDEPSVLSHFEFLEGVMWGSLRLPCYDRQNESPVTLKYVTRKEPYIFIPGTKTKETYGSLFQRLGYMSKAEIDRLILVKEKMPIAVCSWGIGGKKSLYFPAHIIDVRPSDALTAVARRRPDSEVPEPIAIASELYMKGKEDVREVSEKRENMIETIRERLNPIFTIMPKVSGEVKGRPTPRYVKGRDPAKKSVKRGEAYFEKREEDNLTFGKTLVIVPEGTELNGLGINRYFNDKKTSMFSRAGQEFEFDFFEPKLLTRAVSIPLEIDRLLFSHPEAKGVIIVWPSTDYRHNAAEMEFFIRGLAVQHVIRDGDLALKLGNIIAGLDRFSQEVTSRFTVFLQEVMKPFHAIVAMDVSHFKGYSIPAYPYLLPDGTTHVLIPENLDMNEGEQRSDDEIIDRLRLLAKRLKKIVDRASILLLRDGWAQEDYATIQKAVSDEMDLTVIGIRKGLIMGDADKKDEVAEIEHYTIYAEGAGQDFFFAAEARLGKGQPLPKLNIATVVTNPLDISKKALATLVMELCFHQRTTERGVGGLPHPLSYADRLAGDLRAKITCDGVISWLTKNHSDLVNKAGGHEQAVYQIIRDFIMNHPNGSLFAL